MTKRTLWAYDALGGQTMPNPEVRTITATATGRPNLIGGRINALIHVPLTGDPEDGGIIDEVALGAILRQRGVIDYGTPEVTAERYTEDWVFAVLNARTGERIATLEIHAGAGA